MKKIFKKVLKKYNRSNTTHDNTTHELTKLVSELRDQVSKLQDSMHILWEAEDKLEEDTARKSWVCSVCGKNTYDVEWDYIGTGTNHLGCELKTYNETKIKA